MRKTGLVAALLVSAAMLTGCDYDMVPKTPTTSTPAPASPQAKGRTLTGGDEFNYSGKPDTKKWGMYDGAGHAGKGRRTPNAFSVDGQKLIVKGNGGGETGGMAYRTGQKFGYWEAKVRVPRGDSQYHPVLLLWPDKEDFPVGGEVDYYETTTASNKVDFFLHYSSANKTTHDEVAVDQTKWNTVGVEWTSKGIIGYMNGTEFFRDTDTSHLPPRSMHMTIQLDYFPKAGSPAPSSMEVDYVRQYK